VFDQFSDDSQDIGDKGFQSVLCFTVNDTEAEKEREGRAIDLWFLKCPVTKGSEFNLFISKNKG
jgi:hypothetical protein